MGCQAFFLTFFFGVGASYTLHLTCYTRLKLGKLLLIVSALTHKPPLRGRFEKAIDACVFLGTVVPLTQLARELTSQPVSWPAKPASLTTNQWSTMQSNIQKNSHLVSHSPPTSQLANLPASLPTNQPATDPTKPSVLPRCHQMKQPHTHPVVLPGNKFTNSLSQRPASFSAS